MKKKLFKINNSVDFNQHRKAVKNAFGEDGAKAKEALLSLLDEMENSEVEYDEAAFAEEVKKALMNLDEAPEAIQNSVSAIVAKKVLDIQNAIGAGMDAKTKFTPTVKNAIAAAILRVQTAGADSRQNAELVQNAVEKILVENQITGLAFGDVIDYTIATKWENTNPLFAQLYQTKVTKFHYTEDEMLAAAVIAKQWDKASEAGVEKSIQMIAAETKAILTDYIYKRQQVDAVDMDAIELAGEASSFLAWVTQELRNQTINTIIMAILIGDAVNVNGKKITTFETIGTKVATDVFTHVGTTAVVDEVTVSEVRLMCDKVVNRFGKKKVLTMSQSLLTALSGFTYAAGGDTHYRSKEEMAGQFGVDEIFVTDILGETKIICFIPQGYWIRIVKEFQVAYPTYAENRQNYQFEMNAGGKIHDLQSSALLNVKQA